jgi:hypothetical protein
MFPRSDEKFVRALRRCNERSDFTLLAREKSWWSTLRVATLVGAVAFAALGLVDSTLAANKKVIGATVLSLQSPYLVAISEAMKAEAAKEGLGLISLDSERSVMTERSHVETLINSKVDLIIMTPIDQSTSRLRRGWSTRQASLSSSWKQNLTTTFDPMVGSSLPLSGRTTPWPARSRDGTSPTNCPQEGTSSTWRSSTVGLPRNFAKPVLSR